MKIVDRILFPLLIVLSPSASARLGLTPLDDERIEVCLRYARGKILDVGCGPNLLVRRHPEGGFGVDVFPWPAADVVCKTQELPFPSRSFDTITLTAVLNHIPAPNRTVALLELKRVLKPEGRLLVTMIGPRVGWLTHRIRFAYDPDQYVRGIGPGEALGLTDPDVRRILDSAGFVVQYRDRFLWGLNNLYVCWVATSHSGMDE